MTIVISPIKPISSAGAVYRGFIRPGLFRIGCGAAVLLLLVVLVIAAALIGGAHVVRWISSSTFALVLIAAVMVFLAVCLADDWRKERRARG